MKKSLLKLVLVGSILSAANFLAPPSADALNCARRYLGCSFIGVTNYGGASCCTYRCPDGSISDGICAVN